MIQWIWSSGWWLDYVCAACSLYQPVTLQALLRPTFDDKQKLACKHYLGQSSSPIHLLLRNIDRSDPDLESFSIVTSPTNQRVEAFWSILLRDKIGWWKRFFQVLLHAVVAKRVFASEIAEKMHQTGMCRLYLYHRVVTKDLVVDLTQCTFYHIFTTDKT